MTSPALNPIPHSQPPAARTDAATPISARQWGPDISRGLALLGIVVANMYYYLQGIGQTVFMKPLDSTGASHVVDVLTILLFDSRGFTLFSLLFGYGIGMLHVRAKRRGQTPGQFYVAMAKRHALLLVIGLLHTVLLFAGDIILTYALLGFIVAAIAIAPRWVGIVVAAIAVLPLAFLGGMNAFAAGGSFGTPDVVGSLDSAIAFRLMILVITVISFPVLATGLLVPMIIGLWLQEWDFFGRASERWGIMAGIAVGGTAVSVIGAIPAVLLYEGAIPWDIGLLDSAIGALHQLTGVIGALGYAATAALAAVRRPAILFPLAALGTMSMSGYLFQSVVSVIVYPAFALGYGASMSSLSALGVSVMTWALTLLVAALLVRLGKRGPAEWLFRRVLYGRPSPAQGADAPHGRQA